MTEATEARQGRQKNFKRNSAERFRVMEVWLERAGPWVEVLLKGVEVTVKVVKGRPKYKVETQIFVKKNLPGKSH